MAKSSNNEELRQQALSAIAQGRAEIRAEVHHLRKELSPSRMMHRVIDRHATLVVVLAFTAGIIPALFLFRRKREDVRARSNMMVSVSNSPPKPAHGSLLLGLLGIVAKTLTPVLMKSAIIPHVVDSFSRKARWRAQTGDRQTVGTSRF